MKIIKPLQKVLSLLLVVMLAVGVMPTVAFAVTSFSDPNTLDFAQINTNMTDEEFVGRFTIDHTNKKVTVSGNDPLTLKGDGTIGGWSVYVEDATNITLDNTLKMYSRYRDLNYWPTLSLLSNDDITITGAGSGVSISSDGGAIIAENGNLTIDGEIGDIKSAIGSNVGILSNGNLTINGVIGDITGRTGIVAGGNLTISESGKVGNIVASAYGMSIGDTLNIAGTVGDITIEYFNAINIGNLDGGSSVISGTVGNITNTSSDGGTDAISYSRGDLIIAGEIGNITGCINGFDHFTTNTGSLTISGKVGLIRSGTAGITATPCNIESSVTIIANNGATYTQPIINIPTYTATWSKNVSGEPATVENNTYTWHYEHKYLKIVAGTALTGMATISNTSPKVGDTLNATLVDGNNSGTLSYSWKVGGVEKGTASTYTVVEDDIGKTIIIEISSSVESGTIPSAPTAAVTAASLIITITFDPNGGAVTPTSGTTDADGKLATLPTPTRTSHDFNGWFTAATGGIEVTANTVFTEDSTIYAQWTYNGGIKTSPGDYFTVKKGSKKVSAIDLEFHPNSFDGDLKNYQYAVQIPGKNPTWKKISKNTVLGISAKAGYTILVSPYKQPGELLDSLVLTQSNISAPKAPSVSVKSMASGIAGTTQLIFSKDYSNSLQFQIAPVVDDLNDMNWLSCPAEPNGKTYPTLAEGNPMEYVFVRAMENDDYPDSQAKKSVKVVVSPNAPDVSIVTTPNEKLNKKPGDNYMDITITLNDNALTFKNLQYAVQDNDISETDPVLTDTKKTKWKSVSSSTIKAVNVPQGKTIFIRIKAKSPLGFSQAKKFVV